MIGDNRFFQEFFDGQIIKPEGLKFKMFKVMLTSVASVLALVLLFCGVINVAGLLLIEFGIIWNVHMKLNNFVSYLVSVLVGFLYFYFAVTYNLFANALVYIACYMPFQLIAITKDYGEGSFVQLRKKINDMNRILFFIFFFVVLAFTSIFASAVGGRFVLIDAFSATLLACSALLRNERYAEYYWFRFIALVLSVALWGMVIVEYGNIEAIAVIVMYAVYIIHDMVTLCMQKTTYVNQYMVEVEKTKKVEDEKLVSEKLKVYEKSKAAETKN